MSGATLERLLLTQAVAGAPSPRLVVVRSALRFNLDALRTAVRTLNTGDCLAYAVPLDGAGAVRLLTLATLSWRLRRAVRAIQRAGLTSIGRYGVEPRLDAPALVYELHTAAARYADRCLRPRGSAEALRRFAARLFGCDPALGAVVVAGRKP